MACSFQENTLPVDVVGDFGFPRGTVVVVPATAGRVGDALGQLVSGEAGDLIHLCRPGGVRLVHDGDDGVGVGRTVAGGETPVVARSKDPGIAAGGHLDAGLHENDVQAVSIRRLDGAAINSRVQVALKLAVVNRAPRQVRRDCRGVQVLAAADVVLRVGKHVHVRAVGDVGQEVGNVPGAGGQVGVVLPGVAVKECFHPDVGQEGAAVVGDGRHQAFFKQLQVRAETRAAGAGGRGATGGGKHGTQARKGATHGRLLWDAGWGRLG
jgi:hypothetical protein